MEFSLLKEKSVVFQGADPYDVSGYVNQHVGSHSIRLSQTSHPAADLSHRKFGDLDLCRISYGGTVRVTSEALETIYHLQILLKGHCLWRGARGQEHHFVPGELLLINPDDPVDLTYSQDCEKFIVKMPGSLLEAACAENHWHWPGEGIRFTASRHSLQEIGGLLNLLGLVCEEAESGIAPPRLQEHYGRIIANKLLCLQNNVRREQPGGASAIFERVVHFIEENLKQDITLEQLAGLVNVSPRSLYALFEKHARTTPRHYVRQKKLERINASLRDPSAPVRNITEVALDYGFLHLGRFSESYRNAFGELPSDTLKRRAC